MAILNILDNAAKWSPRGHAVQVVLDQIDPTTVELTVADSGPGIPAEDRELVFERFYRSTDARSMPGSGLGLAIVRQVVQRHGGTVVAEGKPVESFEGEPAIQEAHAIHEWGWFALDALPSPMTAGTRDAVAALRGR